MISGGRKGESHKAALPGPQAHVIKSFEPVFLHTDHNLVGALN